MMIVKELILSLILGSALSGLVTVLFINNPTTWYKAAKQVKNKLKRK
ncbi:TPA: hypothetical protein ACN1ND_000273 [Enterococcus faecalis]